MGTRRIAADVHRLAPRGGKRKRGLVLACADDAGLAEEFTPEWR